MVKIFAFLASFWLLISGINMSASASELKIKVSYGELLTILEGSAFEKRALAVIEKSITTGRNTKAQAVKIKDKLDDQNRLYALTYTTEANPLQAVMIIVIKLNDQWYRVSETLERSSKWRAWSAENITIR